MIYKWIKYLSDWDENSIDISHYYKDMIESKNEESKSIIMKNENKNKLSNKIHKEEINSGMILKVLY